MIVMICVPEQTITCYYLLFYIYVINFIWTYLYQFFDNFYGLNSSKKPLKRPFNWYQSHFEAINLAKILGKSVDNYHHLLNYWYLGNYHDWCFASRCRRSPLYTAQNEPGMTSRQSVSVEIWSPQCLYMDLIKLSIDNHLPFLRTKDNLYMVKLLHFSSTKALPYVEK